MVRLVAATSTNTNPSRCLFGLLDGGFTSFKSLNEERSLLLSGLYYFTKQGELLYLRIFEKKAFHSKSIVLECKEVESTFSI
jgi:hypothetical protein